MRGIQPYGRVITRQGLHMRFIPNIRYGTEQYPDKIARRLRAVNIAALIAASSVAFFAIHRFLDSIPHWKYAAVVALVYASIPLLHRFGPLTGPLTLVAVAYVWIFWVSSIVGTNGGTYFHYLTAAALGILFVGAEHVFLTVLIGAVAAALIIALHIVVPQDTGYIPTMRLFYGSFVTNVLTG